MKLPLKADLSPFLKRTASPLVRSNLVVSFTNIYYFKLGNCSKKNLQK